jgi:hypothetical protein
VRAWSWTDNIIKIFIFLFFHKKSILLQRDTINEEHNIIRNIYIYVCLFI